MSDTTNVQIDANDVKDSVDILEVIGAVVDLETVGSANKGL